MSTPVDKVFCGKCKHHTVGGLSGTNLCKNNMDERITATRIERHYNYCGDKNKENDCEEYEPSVWTRLFG